MLIRSVSFPSLTDVRSHKIRFELAYPIARKVRKQAMRADEAAGGKLLASEKWK